MSLIDNENIDLALEMLPDLQEEKTNLKNKTSRISDSNEAPTLDSFVDETKSSTSDIVDELSMLPEMSQSTDIVSRDETKNFLNAELEREFIVNHLSDLNIDDENEEHTEFGQLLPDCIPPPPPPISMLVDVESLPNLDDANSENDEQTHELNKSSPHSFSDELPDLPAVT